MVDGRNFLAVIRFNFFALTAWLPTYLIENHGHTIAVATYFTAIIVTCNVCGNLAGTWWLHRGRPRIVLLLTSYTAMAISAAGIFSPVVSVSWKLPLCLNIYVLGRAVARGGIIRGEYPFTVAATSGHSERGLSFKGRILVP